MGGGVKCFLKAWGEHSENPFPMPGRGLQNDFRIKFVLTHVFLREEKSPSRSNALPLPGRVPRNKGVVGLKCRSEPFGQRAPVEP